MNVIGDEEAFKAVDGPMICLGSPTSNNLTSKGLRLLPHGIEIEFTTNTMKCWLHDQPYTSSDLIDYAILVRVVDEAHVYFVCAGIDEEGTVAAAKFLFSNWQKLPISSFVQVFQCDKINRTVKQKLGGKHFIKEQEKWITD